MYERSYWAVENVIKKSLYLAHFIDYYFIDY